MSGDNWFQITPEIKEQFYKSTDSNLIELENSLLLLEKNPADAGIINNAFRAIHTIKGESDYMSFKDMNALAHEMESLMDLIRKSEIHLTPEIIDLLFKCLDRLRSMNALVTKDKYEAQNIDELVKKLQDFQENKEYFDSDKTISTEINVADIYKKTASQHIEYLKQLAEPITKGKSSKGIKEKIIRTLTTFYNSSVYCNFENNSVILQNLKDHVQSKRTLDRASASLILEKLKDIHKNLDEIANPGSNTNDKKLKVDDIFSVDILGKDVKVSMDKIDDFMNQISELGIVKYRFEYLLKTKPTAANFDSWFEEMKNVYDNVQKQSYRLNSGIRKIRLVDINVLFSRLERIVRDLSRRRNKLIHLTLLGSAVEIDRKVVEYLVDPIIHLIRNAIDHGIEEQEQRIASNKSIEGNITISAYRNENQIIIDIVDDGRGINAEKIKKIAIDKKLVTQTEADLLSERELLSFIFYPGFTTTTKVDEISGRGVGLDIVKTNLRTIGGNVTVSTELGKATRFSLQVPVEMITLEVLLTEVGTEKYGFPFSAIFETITVNTQKFKEINHKTIVPYRGELLQIINLEAVLNPHYIQNNNQNTEITLVIINFGNRIIGVVVDKIIGKTEVLSRPLEKHLSVIKEFSGASVLGDGSIVLIIDPTALF